MPFDQSDWELASDYTMNTTFEQSTQPSSPHDGDLWFDTSDGNHQYRYSNQTWADVQDEAIETASTAASEAKQVADAIDQHFWTDANGAHVTEVEQDDWNDSTSQDYHSGANILLNSQGQLLRDGLDTLASFTPSAVSFYDENGDQTAVFGSSGAMVGSTSGVYVDIDGDSVSITDGSTPAVRMRYDGTGGFAKGAVEFFPQYDTYGYNASIVSTGSIMHVNAPDNGPLEIHTNKTDNVNTGDFYESTVNVPRLTTASGSAFNVNTTEKTSGVPSFATVFEVTNSGETTTNALNLEQSAYHPSVNALDVSVSGTSNFSIGWDGSVASSKYGVSTSGSWRVEKRPGGVIEATYNVSNSIAVTTSYGGRYISALQTVNLPSNLFSYIDYANVTAMSSPGIFWAAHTGVSTSSITFYVVANTSLTQTVRRCILVRGR